MQTKDKTGPKLPRAKVLAVLDRAYDRVAFSENDAATIETLRNLFGEILLLAIGRQKLE